MNAAIELRRPDGGPLLTGVATKKWRRSLLSKTAIKNQARTNASTAAALWERWPGTTSGKDDVVNVCDFAGVPYPESTFKKLPEELRVFPEMLKTQAPEWWGRQLKKADKRGAEMHELKQGRITHYCSDLILKARKAYRKAMVEMLSQMLAICTMPDGERVERELIDLIKASPANPAIRRAELMTRIRGFENYAIAKKHVAYFLTPTCPSRFHRNSGERWEEAGGLSPKEGNDYLCTVFARVRAELKRQKIEIYGFRIAEPHKDACPHWHCLFWFKSHHEARRAITIMRNYFLADTPNEKGAQQRRFTTKRIDASKGSATGYVAKYICKNVDGLFDDKGTERKFDDQRKNDAGEMENTGLASDDAAARVEAWASCWGIRQFQQIGGPKVGVWRELRRLGKGEKAQDAGDLEPMRRAADGKQWDLFMVLDDEHLEKYETRVRVWSKTSKDMIAALPKDAPAEAVKPLLSKWQEMSRREVMGIRFGADLAQTLKTRFLKWVLMLKASADAIEKRAKDRKYVAGFLARVKAGRVAFVEKDFAFDYGFLAGAAPPRWPLEYCQ